MRAVDVIRRKRDGYELSREQIEAWRATPAGRFALRLYADERVSLPRAA